MLTSEIKSIDIDPTEFSERSLHQLRSHFPDEDVDTLARYLTARKDDAITAAEQLRRAQKWKQDHYPILKSQCINEIRKGKVYVRGVDREGRPLIVITSRHHNPNERDVNEMLLMTLWFTEIAISRLPSNKSRFTVLIDRDGYDHPGDSEFMQLLSEVFQDVYPERLHRAVVYPSGFVFYAMWHALIKWFMDHRTREKVYPALKLSDVEELIERQYIPASMGGDSKYEFNADDFDDPIAEQMVDSDSVDDENDADVWMEVGSVEGSYPSTEVESSTAKPHIEQSSVFTMLQRAIRLILDLFRPVWLFITGQRIVYEDRSDHATSHVADISDSARASDGIDSATRDRITSALSGRENSQTPKRMTTSAVTSMTVFSVLSALFLVIVAVHLVHMDSENA